MNLLLGLDSIVTILGALSAKRAETTTRLTILFLRGFSFSLAEP